MLVGRLRFVCLQILVLAAACNLQAQTAKAAPGLAGANSAYQIVNLGPSEFSLGSWQFHLGDDPSWKSPSFDDSGWETLSARESWGTQGHANTDGFAWYRCRIDIPAGRQSHDNLAILLQGVENSYEVYWNGRLIGGNGKLPPQPVWYYYPDPLTLDLGPAQSGTLAIRVWKAPFLSYEDGAGGGLWAPPVVGSPPAIARALTAINYRFLRSRQFLFFLNTLYALIALLGLIAWYRDRSQWAVFWMFGFAITKPLSLLLLFGSLPLNIMYLFYAPVFAFGGISLCFLLLWLLDLHRDTRLRRWTIILSIAYFIVQVLEGLTTSGLGLPNPKPFQQWEFRIQFVVMAFEFLPIILVAIAAVRRSRLQLTRWLVALFAFLSQTTIAAGYALSRVTRLTHWTISDRFFMPLFTIIGNRISAQTLFDVFLLIAIVCAVYQSSIERRRRQTALEQEFMSARELQQSLIPADLPTVPGFALTSAYRPAMEVGGDFFQIIPISNAEAGGHATLVLLGDVSGKGLKAAMTVSLIVGATRMLSEFTTSPAEILSGLNRRLVGQLHGGFVTCIALRLYDDGRCEASSAGQPPPFLNDREIGLPGALPLGLFATASYEECAIQLDPQDQLSLYTDGLLEARNPSGELYSFERLKTLFATKPTAEQATDAAVAFGQDDDITVLTLVRHST